MAEERESKENDEIREKPNETDRPNSANDALYITTFGGFSMTYNGKPLVERMQGKTQVGLLLQTMLHNRAFGVDRNLLIQTLFDDRDVEDLSHSIRSILYSSKKKLEAAGLPKTNYFIQKDNVYYWTDDIPVVEDAECFERAYAAAGAETDDEARLKALLDAAHLYTGSFLPNMERVVWIHKERARLREVFAACLRDIDELASRLNHYKSLYEISLYAAKVDPFSKWEVLSIKALVALNRYDEAEALYNKTIDSYILEFGSKSTEYVREVIKELGKYMTYQYDDIDRIQVKLKTQDDEKRGGYFCTFPVFQELYRTVERVMMRSGDHVFLMLCTIVDSKGNPLTGGPKLDELSERLAEALIKSVRHSDTVTKYGKGQYLVLLFDTSKENCSVVQRRIDSNFLQGRQRISLEYSVNKVILSGMDKLETKKPEA